MEDATGPPLDPFEDHVYMKAYFFLMAVGNPGVPKIYEGNDGKRRMGQTFGMSENFADDPVGFRLDCFLRICSGRERFGNRDVETLQCLVTTYGVDPNHHNADGRSGLELAARHDFFELCEVLVRQGATLTAYALEHYGADREGEEVDDDDGPDEQAGPLSEETTAERRVALLMLLPEPERWTEGINLLQQLPEHLRHAEQLKRFHADANWFRRRVLMMFLAEGGHRPLTYRVAAGQDKTPAGMDGLTRLTRDIFSHEKGVSQHIMAML